MEPLSSKNHKHLKKKNKQQKKSFEPHRLSRETNCPVILLVENERKLQTVFQSTVARVIGFPLHPKVLDLLLLIRDIKHWENSYICHISCKIIQVENEMVWSKKSEFERLPVGNA